MKFFDKKVYNKRVIFFFINFQDTTDYSSSDQYEKLPYPIIEQQRIVPLSGPHLNVLMSNPQVNKFLTIIN